MYIRVYSNPPKYEIMQIVSAAQPRVSTAAGPRRQRRRRRGARPAAAATYVAAVRVHGRGPGPLQLPVADTWIFSQFPTRAKQRTTERWRPRLAGGPAGAACAAAAPTPFPGRGGVRGSMQSLCPARRRGRASAVARLREGSTGLAAVNTHLRSETALHWRTKSVSACESRLVQLLPPVNRALHECQNAK